jgi:glycosyltransferase involved in cell wall biosynthesis
MPPQAKANGLPVKGLWIGDIVNPSGFGRIGNEVLSRMVSRGWQFVGASLPWPGYPWADGRKFQFPIFPLGGKDPNAVWGSVQGVIMSEMPDIVIVAQDFPYATTTFHNLKIDWTRHKFITLTPIDGTPIHPQWLELTDLVDATMVISRFGVEAMRMEGKQVDLLHPGVDSNEFYPADSPDEVKALRARMGIPDNAFVTGSFMMNQGRKAVSKTVEVFKEFGRDKPDAFLFLDMDKTSPAGWDIPATMRQLRYEPELAKRVLYREDALKVGIMGLRERYLLCDISCQIAHREGFGLPNLESMACKIPPMVLDWCSGPEIAGGGKAVLVRRIDYMEQGTWGGACDAFPDVSDWLKKWNYLYHNRDAIAAIATKGYPWAKAQTWDKSTDQFEAVYKRVSEQQKKERALFDEHKRAIANPTPALSDAGDSRGNPTTVQPLTQPIDSDPGVQQPAAGDQVPEQPPANG